MFDIQSVPHWPSLTEADTGRGTTLGPGGRRTDCCTVSFWGCRCPTPDSSHYWLMWGDCRLGSGTACWMRTATGWLQSADCWQTLTCCSCCDRISVLTLQAYNCLSIEFEISASFSVLFDSITKNMIEIIRLYLTQLRLPCGVTGLIIILLWTKVHK